MIQANEIIYPYIADTHHGRDFFAAFDGLPFADRLLLVLEPSEQCWLTYFIRDRDGLHILEDFESSKSRRDEDRPHDLPYVKSVIQRSTARDIPGFIEDMYSHYYLELDDDRLNR